VPGCRARENYIYIYIYIYKLIFIHKTNKMLLSVYDVFSPTCFGCYCGHLQGDVTRIRKIQMCVSSVSLAP
jgi:hypothetical protein